METTNQIPLLNPWSKWALITTNLLFLIAGIIGIFRHEMTRGISYAAVGLGMGSYGLLTYHTPEFRLKWLASFIAFVAWFGGAFGIIFSVR
jgi:hypothetical protein